MSRSLVGPLVIVLALCEAGAAEGRPLTLAEAIAMGRTRSLQVQGGTARVVEAEARRRAARGRLGPKLTLEGSFVHWDDKLEFAFPTPSPDLLAANRDVLTKYSDLFQVLPAFFDLGAIREQNTMQLKLSVQQPLTPLYSIWKGYRIAQLGEDAAHLDLHATRNDTALAVVQAYVNLKQGGSAIAIARTAVEQLEAHLGNAEKLAAAGLIGKNDVLRAQVALAEARERLIQARSAEELARTALALLVRLPPEEPLAATDVFPDPPPPFTSPLQACVRAAHRARPELQSLGKRVEMAEKSVDAARWALVPQIAAFGTYEHNEGLGVLQPKNDWLVGLSVRWDFWEWGATYYGIGEARAREALARLGAAQLADSVYLEVKRSYLDVTAAAESLEVNRAAVSQAEENFRIAEQKFGAQAATTVDLLDAQLALTRARLTYSTALHRWYVARAALTRAVGAAVKSLPFAGCD